MGRADKPKAAFAHHSRTKRKELLIYPPSNRKDHQPVQVIGCGITWLAIEPRLSNAARNRTNRSFFRISILELGFAASIHPTASIGAFLFNSFHSRADSVSRGEQVPTPLIKAKLRSASFQAISHTPPREIATLLTWADGPRRV